MRHKKAQFNADWEIKLNLMIYIARGVNGVIQRKIEIKEHVEFFKCLCQY